MTESTFPGYDENATVPAHHGDPLAEQRAMARGAAAVDRGDRGVVTVTGEERLHWLHQLLTQHVSEMPPDTASEALVLDINGRVLHHVVIAHTDDTVFLDTEAADLPALLDYLQKMIFWAKVEVKDATAELAVISVVGPRTPDVLAGAGLPVPGADAALPLSPGFGAVRRMSWPGPDAADLLVPRSSADDVLGRLVAAGATRAGTMAFEALRVEALRPRIHVDTDERTIPHEVRWIDTAVHMAKGCYRGQETVARVANMGRPPRNLVLLHLDGSDDVLPSTGDPVLSGGRPVGRVGTVVQHHELGPVALALVKRSAPTGEDLAAGPEGARVPVRLDPASVPAEDAAPPPGRAAQLKLR